MASKVIPFDAPGKNVYSAVTQGLVFFFFLFLKILRVFFDVDRLY